jgi:hypothetical protein
MSQQRFKQALIVLGLAMLIVIGCIAYQGTRPLSPAEIDQRAEQLIDRITSMRNKEVTACYTIEPSSACERIRAANDGMISLINEARHYSDPSKGITPSSAIVFMSRQVEQFETETAPTLRELEQLAHLSAR